MGYCMNQRETDFRMTAENCLAAKNFLQEAYKRASKDGEVPQNWVSWHSVLNAKTFPRMMQEFRWEVKMNDEGNVVGIEFSGEEIGDEGLFFQMLAPYVEAGCFIEMQGEDGEMWRWCFDGTNCESKYPDISWE